MKSKFKKLFRFWSLRRYAAEQHDLICEATGTGKDYLEDGCTAYESVCILLSKLEAARSYIEKQNTEESIKLLKFLDTPQDDEDFDFLPLH